MAAGFFHSRRCASSGSAGRSRRNGGPLSELLCRGSALRRRRLDSAPVQALVLDVSDALLPALARATCCFQRRLASIRTSLAFILLLSRLWLAADNSEDRSGYQTAVSDAPAGPQAKGAARAKRPTVAQLAVQQEASQLSVLTAQPRTAAAPEAFVPQLPQTPPTCWDLPLCSEVPSLPRQPGQAFSKRSQFLLVCLRMHQEVL